MRLQHCLMIGVACATGEAAVSRRTPVVEAVEKALPTVVNIGTERYVQVRYTDPRMRLRGDLFDQFFQGAFEPPPIPRIERQQSLGSGVVIHEKGYILTNYHVIERASVIKVTLSDESVHLGRLLAGDAISDLALLWIDAGRALKAVEFAEDDEAYLGETVIALGNPFGLAHTVTVGVLSAKNREASYKGEVLYRDILQTDAAVNPGNSGGPLLNLDGKLMGVSVSIYPDAQNIGFAVPVKRARDLLSRWLAPRLLKKLWLGFEPVEAGGRLAVGPIENESPADQAGLDEDDEILSMDGKPVHRLFDFYRHLLSFSPEQPFYLDVRRAEETRSVRLALSDLPKPSGKKLALALLGLEFQESAAEQGKRQYLKGLPVDHVAPDSAAAEAGLVAGLYVMRINDVEISTLDDVGLALENVRPQDAVHLIVVSISESGRVLVAQSAAVSLKARKGS